MLTEKFQHYTIEAAPRRTSKGKWSVSVILKWQVDGKAEERRFYADDGIEYILEVEAAKESINLGKNLIARNEVV